MKIIHSVMCMRYVKKVMNGVICMAALLVLYGTDASAASVKLNKSKAEITVGDTLKLKIKGTKSKIQWSTNNKKVASVSKKGIVKGKKAGKAVITAKVLKKKLNCKIKVSEVEDNTIAAENITLSANTLDIYTNIPVALTANVLPDNATNKLVSWVSSDSAVAKVENGVVTGVSEGNAVITAAVGDVTAECAVHVQKSGLDRLKECILTQNTVDVYGNRYMDCDQFLAVPDFEVKGRIMFNQVKNCFEFIAEYKKSYLQQTMTMTISYGNENATVHMVSKVLKNKPDMDLSDMNFEVSATFKLASYANDTDIIFTYPSGEFKLETEIIANEFMQMSFEKFWSSAIYFSGIRYPEIGLNSYI